ncbi:hypothetical protein [Burkholderia cepacia]|uniref:hypothetical protein n=1 Tax=Burkholderia cepacia TaxID=292 RepID=UPI001CF5216E|nr:hypothetical protein [Burkholderia cepacia]MCA8026410.1 hypothetical protein [Burkholderia cepacia]
MSTPFTVLPQYQGNLYQLQRQQALAQALTQGALQGQQMPATVGSGPYQVAPRYSIGAGISQLGQALLASRLSNQASQGLGQLGAQQWAALTGQGLGAMSNANAGGFGTGAGATPPLQSAPAGQSGAGNDAAAGADGSADNLNTGAQQPQGMLSPGGPMNPIGMPTQQAAMMYMSNPDKYWEAQAGAYKPTDMSLMLRQAGIDPTSALGRQVMQQAIAKQNYIAPSSFRPGGYMYDPMSGSMQQLPNVPEGYTAVRGQNGAWQIVPVQGGLQAMGASAAAKAGGQAQYELREVWDPNANGGQGGYVQQSVANVANAANGGGARGGVPAAGLAGIFAQQESSGGKTAPDNPFQIQQATFNRFAQPGESWNNVADRNAVAQRMLTKFNQDYGGDLGRIAVAYFSGEGNVAPPGSPTPFLRNVADSNGKSVASYVGDILGRSGSLGAPQSGPMASQPPLGQTQAANASQAAPSKQMADSYGSMSTADANYQQSREALNEMLSLAQNKGVGGTAIGLLPEGVGTRISPDAAKYQKLHATYVALQGKALGSGGTDAARATIDEAVPTYDKPQSAMVSGLQTQLANLDMAHLKTQFLTPLYQQGNEKAFTAQSAGFDQNIKPSMIPALQLSGDQQRAAVQAAIKANPALRPNFEWAFNNGMLK